MERLVDLKNKSIEQNSELQRKEKLESLQKLSFGVAHEIRNPLAAIVQSSQNLIRRLEPNLESNKSIAEELGIDMEMIQNYIKEREIINFAENILESSKRVSIIVDGLLKISQLSESEHKYTNIKQIIDSAIDLAQHVNLSFQLPFNKITIINEYPDIIPEICCCSNEIEQVIYSILNNASYALVNIPRLPTITIKVTVIDNDIDINIIDNGHGISSNHANKIFDPFFTTKNLGQGLGLGLTVAHNIITNKHHGKISVDSKENEGTIVTIRLPIHKSMDNNSIT
jgi:signal transduction histidine kinase